MAEKVRTTGRKITFTLDNTQAQIAEAYAHVKGFKTVSSLARYATTIYMAKNPLSKAQRVMVEKIYGEELADAIAPQLEGKGED